ncbi:hypothetical protein [uncultured Clostridium sp.]|uniref:hypothetical protein n=1 Tax=uncultured Clostridium sp. TaxID=59620 RepID=UPI0028E41686|nr:hypothetical protein [uncultured Clostridium sp.]
MKTIFRHMRILILLILSITLIACNKQKSNIEEFIQENQLESIVSKSISDFASSNRNNKAVFESHKIVGKELKRDILSVYVIGYVIGVYDNNQGFGGEFPAHIKIQKTEDNYKVVSYKDALASADVYDIMPKKYAKDIFNYDTSSLSQVVKEQMEDWEKNNKSN